MKQQKQIIVLVVLILAAVGIWGWQWYEPKAGSKGSNSTFLQSYQPLNFPNPTIRWDEVERRRKADYKGAGVNPFSTAVPPNPADLRKAEDDARKIAETHKNDPPPPPPALELPANLKFFGYGNIPNNAARRAFLEDGEEVYIVNEGDTLMGRYKILKINNASLEFEEVGSGRRGQKMLEDQGPTA
jgi:hypothetical protein